MVPYVEIIGPYAHCTSEKCQSSEYHSLFTMHDALKKNNFSNGIRNLMATDSLLIFNYHIDNANLTFVYNLYTKKAFIDDSYCYGPFKYSDSKCIISSINLEHLVGANNYQKLPAELDSILSISNENDNPALMIMTSKY